MSSVVNGRLNSFVYPDQKIHELTHQNGVYRRQLTAMEDHEMVIEIGRLHEIIRLQREALEISHKVCGRNNCNCPGAKQVREAVEKVCKSN